MGTNKRNRFDVSPYLFISPVFILLALLVVYPIAYAFYLSVMDTNLTTKWEFVGLSNYISLLKDGSMINSLKVTFLFTIVVVLYSIFHIPGICRSTGYHGRSIQLHAYGNFLR